MISVIITAYNVEQYVETAIESVIAQTYKDIELIVVLDAPTDSTSEIVKKLARREKCIHIIEHKTNLGAGQSRRDGITYSKGEYVFLLDADDYIKPDCLDELYKEAKRTGADIVSTGTEVLDEEGVRTCHHYGNQEYTGYDRITKFWREKVQYMNNKLISRRLHDLVPYCPLRYCEDTPTLVRMLYYTNKLVYVDSSNYVYRQQPNSLTHTATETKNLIYQGICWCGLIQFFAEKDKKVFDVLPIFDFIIDIVKKLNNGVFTEENIKPYREEFNVLILEIFKILNVDTLSVKI